jgi:hypothetical protein
LHIQHLQFHQLHNPVAIAWEAVGLFRSRTALQLQASLAGLAFLHSTQTALEAVFSVGTKYKPRPLATTPTPRLRSHVARSCSPATMASAELIVAKTALSGALFRPDPRPCSRDDIESMFALVNSTIAECSPPNVQV